MEKSPVRPSDAYFPEWKPALTEAVLFYCCVRVAPVSFVFMHFKSVSLELVISTIHLGGGGGGSRSYL